MSRFLLIIIAMVSMLIDHIGCIILENNYMCRLIGRIAFPIFAFLIVVGYKHTKNLKRYMLRLFILAIISEPIYDYAHSYSKTLLDFHSQNIVWVLLLGLVTIKLLDTVKDKSYYLPALIVTSGLGFILRLDYLWIGIPVVLLFYITNNKRYQLLGLLILSYCFYTLPRYGIPIQAFSLLALPLIWCYNQKMGYTSKIFRLFYYSFYPVHLGLLAILYSFLTAF